MANTALCKHHWSIDIHGGETQGLVVVTVQVQCQATVFRLNSTTSMCNCVQSTEKKTYSEDKFTNVLLSFVVKQTIAVQVWEAVMSLCCFPTRLQDGNNIETRFPKGDFNWIDSTNWFSQGNQPRVAISLFLTNDKSSNCPYLGVFIFHGSKAASHRSLSEQTTLLISKETPYLPWQTLSIFSLGCYKKDRLLAHIQKRR